MTKFEAFHQAQSLKILVVFFTTFPSVYLISYSAVSEQINHHQMFEEIIMFVFNC